MIRTPRRLRAGLAGLAAVALIGTGATALVASSAEAADSENATALRIDALYPDDNGAAAGTCMIYRLTPTNFQGVTAADSGTVVINITENPESDTQDVDFCVPPAAPDGQTGTRFDYGYYRNAIPSGPPASPSTKQSYCSGRSITPPAAAACSKPNDPDRASGQTLQEQDPFNPGQEDTNPTGRDYVDDVKYDNDPATAAQPTIEFGVVGLIPGGATLEAFIDRNTNGTQAASGEPGATKAITFTAGGPPGSVAAYNAVTDITSDRPSYTAVQSPATSAAIELTLRNSVSDTVFGVVPSYRVQSGPNASSTINSCPESNDFGKTTCSYRGTIVGTDTLQFWVNHSAAPNSTATAGPDPGEPTLQVTVTTYAAPSPPSAARFVELTPATASTTAGQSRVFTATVTDSGGAPVQGAAVTFEETGPGQLQGGTSPDGNNSTLTVNTGPDGRALATVTTQTGESGTETITAKISSATTDCGRIFNGQTGVCADTSTNTIGGGPSPSPSATATKSPTATPTATTSASPTASPGCRTAVVTVNTKTVNATGLASVTVSGVQPNSRVELQGYSQNHYGTANFDNDTTNPDRTGTASSSGSVTFSDLRPGSNTRLRARQVGCLYGGSDTINVRTQLSLQVTRVGARQYRFGVDSIPARPGGLIVSIYRITGTSCAAGVEPRNCPGEQFVGQTRVSSVNGEGAVTFTFDRTYPAREQFVLKTGQDAQNFPGRSNVRDLAIF